MIIKNIVHEDFVNYKKPSMFIIFPRCSFKCDKECGRAICQNSALVHSPDIEISVEKIVESYINNPITQSIVIGGLEPFDSAEELDSLIEAFRKKTKDEIIIYTGYTEEEVQDLIEIYKMKYKPFIVKYGRFIPDCESHFDKILGVNLASPNQYAKKYE